MASKLIFFVTVFLLLSQVFACIFTQEVYNETLNAPYIEDYHQILDMDQLSSLLSKAHVDAQVSTTPEHRSPTSVTQHKQIFEKAAPQVQQKVSVTLREFSNHHEVDDSDYFLLYLPETSYPPIVSMSILRKKEEVPVVNLPVVEKEAKAPEVKTSPKSSVERKADEITPTKPLSVPNDTELEKMERGGADEWYWERPEYYFY